METSSKVCNLNILSHELLHMNRFTKYMFFLFDYVQKVGVLVPLNANLEEDTSNSIPRVEISKCINLLGRDVIPITDKRLSRKHVSIIVSADDSAEVLVV